MLKRLQVSALTALTPAFVALLSGCASPEFSNSDSHALTVHTLYAAVFDSIIREPTVKYPAGTPGTGISPLTAMANYPMLPSLAGADECGGADGKLLLSFGRSQTHAVAGSVGELLRSDDFGQSWYGTMRDLGQTMFDAGPSARTNVGSIARLANGRLLVTGIVQCPDFSCSKVVQIHSDDGGATWTSTSAGATIAVTTNTLQGGAPVECLNTTPGQPCPPGRILQPVYWTIVGGSPPEHRKTSEMVYSDDGGTTYHRFGNGLGIMAHDSNPAGIQNTESHVKWLETSTSAPCGPSTATLMALVREDDTVQMIAREYSCDGGQHWWWPETTTSTTQPPAVFSGRNWPGFIPNHPQPGVPSRYDLIYCGANATPGNANLNASTHNVIRVSSDYGRTWSDEINVSNPTLPFGAGGASLGCDVIALGNGRIGIVKTEADNTGGMATLYGINYLTWSVFGPVSAPTTTVSYARPPETPDPRTYFGSAAVAWWTPRMLQDDYVKQGVPVTKWRNAYGNLAYDMVWPGNGTAPKFSGGSDRVGGLYGGPGMLADHLGNPIAEMLVAGSLPQPFQFGCAMDANDSSAELYLLDDGAGHTLRWTQSTSGGVTGHHFYAQSPGTPVKKADFSAPAGQAGAWPTMGNTRFAHTVRFLADGANSALWIDNVQQTKHATTGVLDSNAWAGISLNGHNAGFGQDYRMCWLTLSRSSSVGAALDAAMVSTWIY